MHKSHTFGKSNLFLIAICGIVLSLSSCTEKISGIGALYLKDTVSTGIHAYSDSSAFIFQPIVKQTFIAAGQNVNLTINSSALMIGKVSGDIEAWAAMKMPILPDTIGQVLTDTLILRMRFPYLYGDATDQKIDFSVYTEIGNQVNDSTKSLTIGNLSQIVGTYSGTVTSDSLLTISIPLDTGIMNKNLRTASLSLVLVPNSNMNTVRAFASNENGDNTFSPTLKLSVINPTRKDTAKITRNPTIDFAIVTDHAAPPPTGEFALRGSYAERERIVINLKNIRTQLQLNPFVTINSALLQLHSDSKLHTSSNVPLDTTPPALADIPNGSVGDSGRTFLGYGSHGTVDPDMYSFQIRDTIEHALRAGEDSVVIELRAGFAYRIFNGSQVDVEDYNINRWVFYGMDYAADKAKRPALIISYSFLR